ncbi:uncharacterized protein N7511_011541 [Penicillium nucicola]|uniref:uncharacterized protein n=1 Tax=Penicillium nucicola TaxID=1850975 RepID=UPI0025453B6F|nr:uncharacterized protein N7511_011541 [Penicillium nucicola]KAJ5742355.1 hypothetical protein N7511_011541 [Penicillium nucicola]
MISSQTTVDETGVKKHLEAKLAKDGNASQWTSQLLQHLIVQFDDPQKTNLPELLTRIQMYTTTMKKRREKKSHIWTLGELNYLFEQYIVTKMPFVAYRQDLPRLSSPRRGATWYPMAFRKRIWPGKEIQKHNGLSQWLQAMDHDSDLNSVLAPVFAKMFLEDAGLLPHDFLPQSSLQAYMGHCVDKRGTVPFSSVSG